MLGTRGGVGRTELNLSVNAVNQLLNTVDATATGCSWASGGNTITLGTVAGNISVGDLVYSVTAGIPLWATVTAVNKNKGYRNVTVQCLGNSTTPFTAAGSSASVTFYVPFNVKDYTTALLQTFGTWVGTISLYASIDGINFSIVSSANNGAIQSTITTNGMFNIPLGFPYLALLCTTYTSGTIKSQISFNYQAISIV